MIQILFNMKFTPIKPGKKVPYKIYEKDIFEKKFEGRVCYILEIMVRHNGQEFSMIKIGYTDNLFTYYCPLEEKNIYGRIYTIITDLRKYYQYVKISKIHAIFKEKSNIPIKRFENKFLILTEKYKIDIHSKKEYRSKDNINQIIKIGQDMVNNFPNQFEIIF